MAGPWVRRLAWLPDPEVSVVHRWTWGVLAVVMAVASAIACVAALTPAVTGLTMGTFFSLLVTVGSVLEPARLRDVCLEEMAHRDGVGFSRWIGKDPVATDPAGYLRSSTPSSSA